jgi:elongation factor 2
MKDPTRIRNIATSSHVHHGKTTLTDNLAALAGMMSEKTVGDVESGMLTWFDEQERERQLTIYGANVSMLHEQDGKDYLINLLDTPGHVDFGGDVTKAMRAVDGTIVLICGVEGIMPQTETVFRQALRERVKPVLFINKVDRLVRELKLTPEMMQKRFEDLIRDVNILIQKYVENRYKNEWLVSVKDGTVAFGSAYKKWAISIPFMEKTGITFKDIIDMINNGQDDELARKAPLHTVVLDMIIKHLPNPLEAQKYRLEKIWKGDLNSDIGKNMLTCNPDGNLAMIITKMVPDPHVGFVATGRLFSGKIYKGKDVRLIELNKNEKIQQVAIYKGIARIQVEEVKAGNIAAIVGLSDASSGETVCDIDNVIEPFEKIKHIFEPVVTKAIEPKNPMDLPKLIDALKKIGREDTTLQVKINQETGEYLVSGLGELHLDAKVERKLKEMGLEIETSQPVVVYRETVQTRSPEIEGKSPNKHNKFHIYIEPMDEKIIEGMSKGEIPSEVDFKKKHLDVQKELIKIGMSARDVKNIWMIYNKSMLIDATKGIQYLNEVEEMLKDAFKNVMEDGPQAREPCIGLKVVLFNAELHEDPVHRGPGQILPAFRHAILSGMMQSNPTVLEPKQVIRIDVPTDIMSGAIREVQNRRGQILNMEEERGATIIIAKMPVAEMFGFNSNLKSSTGGKGFYSLVDVVFEKIPKELQDQTIKRIRKRKGLPEQIAKFD